MDSLTQYIRHYDEHAATICAHAPEALNRLRPHALARLAAARFPRKGDESYPAISIDELFAPDFGLNINRMAMPVDMTATMHCGVPNISTLLGVVVGDTFRPSTSLERNMPEGVTFCSLARAAETHPEIIEKYYGRLASGRNAAADLNTLLAQDGVFVHIAAGTVVDRPLQLINIFNSTAPFMASRRVLVVVEQDADARMLVCDHTQERNVPCLSNQVVEVFIGENARFDWYDLEESSDDTSRVSQLFVDQQAHSRFSLNGTTLMAGRTRNNYFIDHSGPSCSTRLTGMAIGMADQVVDNFTCVGHHFPECKSEQIFKYILDDNSQGSFYGTVIVDEAARFTDARQTNRNILASADARMYTRPRLEINCDEVKCSHGATVGQLDANALFYMRSRGIPEAEAKMMLMQAFMSDVIDTVEIDALRTRLHQLVERRLSGEAARCADCKI